MPFVEKPLKKSIVACKIKLKQVFVCCIYFKYYVHFQFLLTVMCNDKHLPPLNFVKAS